MNSSILELHRARKRLETFCHQRNWSSRDASKWCLSQHDTEIMISTYTAEHGTTPVLRLCFEAGHWLLSMPAANGRWQAYSPRPQVDSIEALIEELEQAPLHVHWG